jgi:NAD dependent epimerase/dehydratase
MINLQNVLVTGAGGFVGSHLTENLVRNGSKVRALCHYNSTHTCGWLDGLGKSILSQIEIIHGDICDLNEVKKAMDGIDVVYHLAALISIPYSYLAVESYVNTNILGTQNILQASRDLNVSRVLVTSTSEVYGTAITVPIDEKHPRQAQSPYAATKIGADALAESFYKSYDLPVTIVRPFNTYGPRQSARAIIPSIIIQLLSGSTQIKLGNITPTRDLVYVKDTVNAYQKIAETDSLIGEDVNIATECEISIGELAQKLIDEINPSAKIIIEDKRLRPSTSEVFRLFGSNQKLFQHTQWKPTIAIELGLKNTIDWLRLTENFKKYNPNIYSI